MDSVGKLKFIGRKNQTMKVVYKDVVVGEVRQMKSPKQGDYPFWMALFDSGNTFYGDTEEEVYDQISAYFSSTNHAEGSFKC